MKAKLLSSALLAVAIAVGSLFGAGSANADANPAVCNGIDEYSTYEAYLINAYVWGRAFNYPPSVQARNIVDSAVVYCPWHVPGLRQAASNLSHNPLYV